MPQKQRTVIVGGGVIGAATAFFIGRHKQFDKETHEIVIIEAVRPACAASGKAGGLLSKTAFPKSLGRLSFKLHNELAAEFGGDKLWGFRNVSTVSVEGSDTPNKPRKTKLPKDLNWINADLLQSAEVLGGPGEFAQVHPYFFTNFLIDHSKEHSNLKLIIGKVSNVLLNKEGACQGVYYTTSGETQEKLMDADNVIVTAGPWTSRLIKSCPVLGMKVPSITVEPTKQVSAFALFTELDLGKSGQVAPEIYARSNEIYICGETIDDPLPDSADDISVDDSYGDALFKYGSLLSENIAGGRIKRRQACYLPVVDSPHTSGPFVGRTNVPNLLMAAGHTCWGINNAPATGLLMAETLFERSTKSSNINALIPASFFDASTGLLLESKASL